jgi:hypothetical protein
MLICAGGEKQSWPRPGPIRGPLFDQLVGDREKRFLPSALAVLRLITSSNLSGREIEIDRRRSRATAAATQARLIRIFDDVLPDHLLRLVALRGEPFPVL